MKSFSKSAIILIILLGGFFIWGIRLVPFHPDETSYLSISEDTERYLQAPLSLAWTPNQAETPANTYRVLNAPLSTYLIGTSRLLLGCGWREVPLDWDWQASYQDNIDRGAYPNDCTLNAGRFINTLLLIVSLPLFYLITKRLGGEYAGLIGLVLFGLNSLVLLHGRRSMAEGTLLFTIILAAWLLLDADRRPIWAGIGIGLAIMSKYTPIGLTLAGVIAIIWQSQSKNRNFKLILKRLVQYGSALAITVLLLAPLLWKHPIGATQAMLTERKDFTNSGIELFNELAPEKVLNTPQERLFSMVMNLYIVEPAIWDVGNYINDQTTEKQTYFTNPLHRLTNNFISGGILLILTLSGTLLSIIRFRSAKAKYQRDITLILLATLFIFSTLMIVVPINFQRYVLPLLPFLLIWATQITPNKKNSGLVN